MKNIVLALVLVIGLTACSQAIPFPREQIIANLSPVLEVEMRVVRILDGINVLNRMGLITDKVSLILKTHFDVYYVYHQEALSYLSRGNIGDYLTYIKLASMELDSMEHVFKDLLAN